MNVYQNYCYSSINGAADAELASGVIGFGGGIAAPLGYTVLSDTEVSLVYGVSSVPSTLSLTRVYPLCTEIGYVHNLTGLSVADAVESSWLVGGVWVAVAIIMSLRKGV